jgi:uncharacterized protein (DUF1778 family)
MQRRGRLALRSTSSGERSLLRHAVRSRAMRRRSRSSAIVASCRAYAASIIEHKQAEQIAQPSSPTYRAAERHSEHVTA